MLLAIESLSPTLWCLSFKVELERKLGLLKTTLGRKGLFIVLSSFLSTGGSERGKGTKDRLRALEARDGHEVVP